MDSGRVHYTHNQGVIELRQAIARKLAEDNGLVVDPEQGIMVTAGSCEAVGVAVLGYVNPGDEVLIPSPAWTNYVAVTHLAGGIPVEVPSRPEEGFLPNPDALRRRVNARTRLLILNSPNNPTGVVYPEPVLRGIAEVAESAGLIVISDEIYERILYGGTPHVPFAGLPGMGERTLTINGLSKTFSMTGWRIGYLAGPPALIQPLVRIHQNLVASACSFVQWGAAEALGGPGDCIAQMVAEYRIRRDLVWETLSAVSGVRLVRPEGAFYAFPGLSRPGLSAEELAHRLLEEAHVAVVPGGVFGPGGDGHVRLSFCCATADVKEGTARMAAFLGQL
jgi:aspartate/methionine/tyrosine aminotransferase